jgi:hypothetical protein
MPSSPLTQRDFVAALSATCGTRTETHRNIHTREHTHVPTPGGSECNKSTVSSVCTGKPLNAIEVGLGNVVRREAAVRYGTHKQQVDIREQDSEC